MCRSGARLQFLLHALADRTSDKQAAFDTLSQMVFDHRNVILCSAAVLGHDLI
jgi:hypothetical protein